MSEYKHILVPIDFSQLSRLAAEQAVSLAECFNAKLLLLHVIERFPEHLPHYHMLDENKDPEEFLIDRARRHLSDMCLQLGKEDIGYEVILSTHSAKTELVKYVEQNDIDLIVLGARGRHGLSDLLGGSTATGLVRAAPCDVLTVRGKNEP